MQRCSMIKDVGYARGLMKYKTDTIAAQATPPGRGGVGIVRISGPKVLSIAEAIFNKKIEARTANFCNFFTHDKKVIDQGIAIYFAAPHSFTGEEVLELQGHGGQVVMDLLLQRVLELGARLAKPGEFLERAFLNNKLDLTQVEAVADLINASSSQAAQNAMRSFQGEFAREVNELLNQLIKLRVYVESTIDFVEEEEIERFAFNYKQELENILHQLAKLQKTARQGMILQEGITVVIAGDPNVGKSSLLNYFSGQDTAIVTNIPGTTRDILRIWVQANGLPINFLDTAGFHDKPDLVEAEGIKRAWEEIKKADHILLVVDAAANKIREPLKLGADFLKLLPEHTRLTVLYNKIDLTGEREQLIKGERVDSIYISVKTRQGLDLLQQHLKDSAGFCSIGDGFSARKRHLDALSQTEKSLQNIGNDPSIINNVELIAEELKEAQQALGEITGKFTSDDLLNRIFSEFCLGK